MMRNLFKKRFVPGPESEQEKRTNEADQMMSEWYSGTGLKRGARAFQSRPTGSWHSIILLLIVFAFIMALGVLSVYWIIRGSPLPLGTPTSPEADALALELSVPDAVDSGDTITIGVAYSNHGKARLTDLSLTLFYPDNFIFFSSTPHEPQDFDKSHWRLPTLDSQTSRKLEITGQIVGTRDEVKTIDAVFTYKPTNFHSTFKRQATAEVRIHQSVLGVSITAPDNLLVSQDVSYTVQVVNQSPTTLEDVVVRLSYPPDLTLSKESATRAESLWRIKTLAPGEEKRLTLEGKLSAKPSALESFRAEAGFLRNGDFVLQNQAVHVAGVIGLDVTIVAQRIDATSPLSLGESLDLTIAVKNLSTLTLKSGVVELTIADPSAIILWDTFRVSPAYTYEIIREGSGLDEDEQRIRLIGLPDSEPVEEYEFMVNVNLIEVPYDPEFFEYALEITPQLSVVSEDLSVPVLIVGDTLSIDVEKL